MGRKRKKITIDVNESTTIYREETKDNIVQYTIEDKDGFCIKKIQEQQDNNKIGGYGTLRGLPEGYEGFTTTNQPSPEAKRLGWQKIRAERHLTKGLIALLLDKKGEPTERLKYYLQSLIDNAAAGNPKAIDTVNKALEDDIIKIAQVDSEGRDLIPVFNIITKGVNPVIDAEIVPNNE